MVRPTVAAALLVACLAGASAALPAPARPAAARARRWRNNTPRPSQTARAAADAALWKWLAESGAVVNFRPHYSGARGGVTFADIPAGGLVRIGAAFLAPWEERGGEGSATFALG